MKHFGIRVIENSDKNAKPNTVTVWLAGKYLGIHETMLILVLAFDTKMGCLMKIKAKSTNEELTEELIASIS